MSNVNQIGLHHATQTTASVWVRSTTPGVMVVSVNGQQFSGTTIDTSVNDGCGICTITGLSAGMVYPYTVSVGGTQVGSGNLRTLPADGATFAIGWGTCVGYLREPLPLRALVQQVPDLVGMCWLGDTIYPSEPVDGSTVTVNGEALKGVERVSPFSQSASMAEHYKHYRAYWQQSAFSDLLQRVPHWFVADDHDHNVGNDWDNTLAAANAVYSWASTLAQAQTMAGWTEDAFTAYTLGNPRGANWYWSVRVNADVEMFFVDGVAYRDPVGGDGSILGAAQKAWLKAGIANSTAPFKLIMSGKNLWGGADDFSKYPTERAEMLAFFDTYATWVQPGGVVWLSGDIHYPYMSYDPTHPLVNVCASPAGTGYQTGVSDGYLNKQAWKCSGYTSMGADETNCYSVAGYVRSLAGQRLEIGLIDSYGATVWRGYVDRGSNAVAYR